MLHNLFVMLNFINELNIYKLWNQKNNDDKNDENASHEYEDR